jgi:hypothetical protein
VLGKDKAEAVRTEHVERMTPKVGDRIGERGAYLVSRVNRETHVVTVMPNTPFNRLVIRLRLFWVWLVSVLQRRSA